MPIQTGSGLFCTTFCIVLNAHWIISIYVVLHCCIFNILYKKNKINNKKWNKQITLGSITEWDGLLPPHMRQVVLFFVNNNVAQFSCYAPKHRL